MRDLNLIKFGITKERGAQSEFNGHGPWFNSGRTNMNQEHPKKFFNEIGLISTLMRN
jgi:RNA-directed DNA polymerase